MITKFFLAVACCLPLGLLAQKSFTIHGKVGTLNAPAKALLSYNNGDSLIKDSAVLQDGRFTFTGRLNAPTEADLVIKHDTVTRPRFSRSDDLHFYIESADITVTAADSIWRAEVKGSVTNKEEKLLQAMQRPYRLSADSLKTAYNARTPQERKDSVWRKAAGIIMTATSAGYDSVTHVFIATHPGSYISLLAFRELELAYNFNPDTAALKFARFPVNLRESAAGKKMAAIIATGKKTNTGVVAMDFAQNDTTGKLVKLSDFRGHYVLIDFWASWCAPCRAENPNYLKAYNKYKDKNFTILGVSLDDTATRKAWLRAVQVDHLPWAQTSELKGFESKAAVLYGVSAIPSNFLVDPNGQIIGRNLRGEELDKKLSTLFSTAQKQYILSGSISGLSAPAKAYLSYGQGADEFRDSTDIAKTGQFQFRGSVTEPIQAFLTVKQDVPHQGQGKAHPDYLVFFLENSNISIVAADSIKNAVVKGSQADNEDRELSAAIAPLTNAIIRLNNTYRGKPKDEAYKKASDSVTQLVAGIRDIQLQFVKAHLNSFIGLYTFYHFVLDSKFEAAAVEPLYGQFSVEMKASGLGQLTLQKIDVARRRQTGIKATDFTQNDLSGKPFTLSSLRGKYVLVDFWASWCVPCRAENPNLVRAYKQLKAENKNFEVIGVSLDQGHAAWEGAVQKDSLPWIHVCDLQGWKNAVALTYGISAVPQNLLIDPTGVIIAKNLRGEELSNKLEALIK